MSVDVYGAPDYGPIMPAVRITIAAHKGGVGKSATTAALAGALALTGHRVLAVDTDPQGALGALLGVPSPQPPGLYEVLTGGVPATAAVVRSSTPGLLLLPATRDLAAADLELPRRAGWRRALAAALATIPAGAADVILIDSPPGLGVLPVLALGAATHVAVVTELEHLSIRALPDALDTVRQVVTTAGGSPRLLGIVPNSVDLRTLHQRDAYGRLRELYEPWILPGLPARVSVKEAGLAGLPISLYDPHGDITVAVTALAQEVARRALVPDAPTPAQHE
ncbi:ATPase involved in chromosome partitioning [Frankia torreyi]|uniref:ATPase involved in chromosome partitioning n=1 Tax=Frankia torreyi TaxID=1856 RepID=A0A0D8B634_9ACTN|nr:ParA family protein [Frankia torreyi]KJE19728.1 ATPase involved in chromosome partitioning [Frankia torreyi]